MVDLWAFTKAEDNPSDLRKYMAKFFTQKFFQMKIVNSVFKKLRNYVFAVSLTSVGNNFCKLTA